MKKLPSHIGVFAPVAFDFLNPSRHLHSGLSPPIGNKGSRTQIEEESQLCPVGHGSESVDEEKVTNK